jgi:hypothetical protein
MNIFYFAYDHQKPTGGQKAVYRHVDALNNKKYSAFVLHSQEDFRLTWFKNETRVIGPKELKKLYNVNEDYIVLPEDLGKNILTFPGKKVIINQGPYLGFACYGLDAPEQYPYLNADIKAILVKSEHSRQYLQFAYPNQKFIRVYDGVDSARFPFVPVDKKEKLIAAPKFKNQLDLMQEYNILQSRAQQEINGLKDYQWVFIDNMREEEVSTVLGKAMLFIFLSTIEGFGILPLEAMLSGCMVAAYQVAPLTEYLSPKYSIMHDRGDVVGVVKSIEQLTAQYDSSAEAILPITQAARNAAQIFSLAKEESSVVDAWRAILAP